MPQNHTPSMFKLIKLAFNGDFKVTVPVSMIVSAVFVHLLDLVFIYLALTHVQLVTAHQDFTFVMTIEVTVVLINVMLGSSFINVLKQAYQKQINE